MRFSSPNTQQLEQPYGHRKADQIVLYRLEALPQTLAEMLSLLDILNVLLMTTKTSMVNQFLIPLGTKTFSYPNSTALEHGVTASILEAEMKTMGLE